MANQKGFTLVEGLLVVIAVSLLGFTGYYVYNANQKKDDTKQVAAPTSSQNTTETKDPTEGWKSFESMEGKYSLKYPASWMIPGNLSDCAPGMLLLGTSEDTLGKCGSEYSGHMSVYSSNESSEGVELTGSDYSDLKTTKVVVDGAEGTRHTGTYSGENLDLGPQKGDKMTQYIFAKNGRTYVALYRHNQSAEKYPDVLNDFDLMITKTLKFNP
jgi:hypothetical protein